MPSKPWTALPAVHVEGTVYRVASSSEPGKTYDVDLSGPICPCDAGQEGRSCKHVRAAIALSEQREQQAAMDLDAPEKSKAKARTSRLDRLGYEFSEVTSAMQKAIRAGDEEAALYWGVLLAEASTPYCWKRLLVCAAEDVGLAAPDTVALVYTLNQGWRAMRESSYYVSLHPVSLAILALCRAPKDTSAEDALTYTLELQKRGFTIPMPPIAVDAHTKAGKAAGRTWAEWYDGRRTAGIPLSLYTKKLAELVPEWFSDELKAELEAFD